MKNARWAWWAAGGLVLVVGVALVVWLRWEPSGPAVIGTVYLNGKLVPKGSIAMAPIEGTEGPGGGGTIREGKYEIRRGLQPGKYRVEIRSTIALDREARNPTIPSELVKQEVTVIPEKYNSKSELIREVKPGTNELNYNLEGPEVRK